MKFNSTEDRSILENIIHRFIEGTISEDPRFDGKYLVSHTQGQQSLDTIRTWIRDSGIIDTVRQRLKRYQQGSLTSLYFNRQAAAMGKIALLDLDDNPALGPVLLQIIADSEEELNDLIDDLAPKTYDGRIVTKEEALEIIAKKKAEKEKRRKR